MHMVIIRSILQFTFAVTYAVTELRILKQDFKVAKNMGFRTNQAQIGSASPIAKQHCAALCSSLKECCSFTYKANVKTCLLNSCCVPAIEPSLNQEVWMKHTVLGKLFYIFIISVRKYICSFCVTLSQKTFIMLMS